MTPGNDNTSDAYLSRIREAVAQSGPLQAWLKQRSTQDGELPSKSTQLLLDSLTKGVEPNQWLTDPKLASLLPILLRGTSEKDPTKLEAWYRLLLSNRNSPVDFIKRYYYPIGIAVSSLAVFYYVCSWIVPEFQKMFDDFQLRLPPVTQFVFSISSFITKNTLPFILMILCGILVISGLLKWASYLLDRLEGFRFVRLMRRGTKNSLGAMARWSGTLSELIAIGAPVDRAILVAGLASQRPLLQSQSNTLATAVKLHPQEPIGNFPEAGYFSSSSIEALDQNRRNPFGAPVLRQIAESYAVRWSSREDFSYEWLGPILLILIAQMIFLLVLALFSPMISLMTVLTS